MRNSRCQYRESRATKECGRERRYIIGYRSDDGILTWLPVCGTHDKYIGRHNLVDNYGWSLEDAIRFEARPDDPIERNSGTRFISSKHGRKLQRVEN